MHTRLCAMIEWPVAIPRSKSQHATYSPWCCCICRNLQLWGLTLYHRNPLSACPLFTRIKGHALKKKRFQQYHLWSVEDMIFPDCAASPGEEFSSTSRATSVIPVGIVSRFIVLVLLCCIVARSLCIRLVRLESFCSCSCVPNVRNEALT